jgi:hypothetical protein
MQQTTTDTEQRVIDILTAHPVTADAYAAPVHAVDRAMGWGTAETRKFVAGLIERGLIHFVPVVRHGRIYDPRSFWKEGARLQKKPSFHAETEDGGVLCGKSRTEFTEGEYLFSHNDWNGVTCPACNERRHFGPEDLDLANQILNRF